MKKKTQIDPMKGSPFVRVITRDGGTLPKFKSEKEFQKAVVKMFTFWGWKVAAFNETGRRTWKGNIGWPDLFMVKAKKLIALELKYGSNTTTREQDEWHIWLRYAGVKMKTCWPEQWQYLERLARGEE